MRSPFSGIKTPFNQGPFLSGVTGGFAGTLSDYSSLNPMIIGHRGGVLFHPEHAQIAYEDLYAAGHRVFEPDVIATSDGELALSHDNTAATLTDGTGNISEITAATWKSFTIDANEDPPGYDPQNAAILSEVVTAVPDAIYVPELKRADQAVLKSYLDGLPADKGKWLIQSFDLSRLTALKADGYETMPMYANPTAPQISSAVSNGYEWMGMRDDTAESVVTDAANAGLKPIMWTIDRRIVWEPYQSAGAVGCFSNTPQYINGYTSASDTWDTGFLMPGMLHQSNPGTASSAIGSVQAVDRGEIFSGGYWGWAAANTVGPFRDFVLQGWATAPSKKDDDNYTVEFTAQITALGPAGTSGWFAFAMHDDALGDGSFADSSASSENGYNIIFRGNGEIAIFLKNNGSASLLDSDTSGGTLSLNTDYHYRVTISPTSVSASRLDAPGGTAQETATTANTAKRGGYFSLGRSQVAARFKDVSVDRSPPFNPATLSPQAWFDLDDEAGVTLTDNYVSQVDDKSGNDNHATTATVAIRADYGYIVGGRKALGFAGTLNNSTEQGSLLITPWVPEDDFWVAFTFQRGPQRDRTGSTVRPIFTCGGSELNEISVGTRNSNSSEDNTLYIFADGGLVTQSANDSFQSGDRANCVFQYSRNNYMRLYVDGVLLLEQTTNITQAPTTLFLGGSPHTPVRRVNGLLPEFVGGNGILTGEDIAGLSSYLASKYSAGASKSLMYQINNTATEVKNATQGVAISSDGFVFTATAAHSINKFLVTTYSADRTTTLQTYDTSVDLPANADQANTLFFDEDTDKLYVGSNNYRDSPAQGWILEYDVNTTTGALTFVARHDVGAYWNEGCTKYGGYFWTFYHNDWAIHQYDLDWNFVARHELEISNPENTSEKILIQGGHFVDDILYIVIHNGNPRSPTMYALHWTGTRFDGVSLGIYPGVDGGQGFDYDGTQFLQASRGGGSTSNPRLKISTADFRTALVG